MEDDPAAAVWRDEVFNNDLVFKETEPETDLVVILAAGSHDASADGHRGHRTPGSAGAFEATSDTPVAERINPFERYCGRPWTAIPSSKPVVRCQHSGPRTQEAALDDNRLALGENRREAQHEETTSTVEHDVNEDLAKRAEHGSAAESDRLDKVAGDMRTHAIDEVEGQGRVNSRGCFFARISQVADYLFAIRKTAV